MLENVEGRRKRRQQRIRQLDSTIDSMDMNLSKLWEAAQPGVLQSMELDKTK